LDEDDDEDWVFLAALVAADTVKEAQVRPRREMGDEVALEPEAP